MDTDKIEECLDTLDKMMNFFGADESDKTPRAVTAAREQLAALKQAAPAGEIVEFGECPVNRWKYRLAVGEVKTSLDGSKWFRSEAFYKPVRDEDHQVRDWLLSKIAAHYGITMVDAAELAELREKAVKYDILRGDLECIVNGACSQ